MYLALIGGVFMTAQIVFEIRGKGNKYSLGHMFGVDTYNFPLIEHYEQLGGGKQGQLAHTCVKNIFYALRLDNTK